MCLLLPLLPSCAVSLSSHLESGNGRRKLGPWPSRTSPDSFTSGLWPCLSPLFGFHHIQPWLQRHCLNLVTFVSSPVPLTRSVLDFFNLSGLLLYNWWSFMLTITSARWFMIISVFLIFTSLLNIVPIFLSVYGVSLPGCSPGTLNTWNLHSKLNLTSFLKHVPPSIPYFYWLHSANPMNLAQNLSIILKTLPSSFFHISL